MKDIFTELDRETVITQSKLNAAMIDEIVQDFKEQMKLSEEREETREITKLNRILSSYSKRIDHCRITT